MGLSAVGPIVLGGGCGGRLHAVIARVSAMRGWRAAARTPTIPPMKDTHMIDRLSHDLLWDQVIRREPGDFLYAVTTMGVYCRSGCPSPRPLRKNVRFFSSPAEAEAAGFRSCKRCDPKGDRKRLGEAVVRDACEFIETSETMPSLDAL